MQALSWMNEKLSAFRSSYIVQAELYAIMAHFSYYIAYLTSAQPGSD